jgi:hypothetical protein
MGTAMGVLALQRGLLPLHASAVEVNGECVAFVGRSGAGKSTLAACLARRGYPLVADDMMTVGFDAAGAAIAWRGAPEVKLWGSALDAIGETGAELIPVRPGLAKYYAPAKLSRADSLPLRRIYLLDGETGPEPRGLAAVRALRRHCHGAGRASMVLGEARQLGRLTQLLRGVTVERLDIQHGLERLHDEVARVEARIAAPVAT